MTLTPGIKDLLAASFSEVVVTSVGAVTATALEDPVMTLVAVSATCNGTLLVATGFMLRHMLRNRLLKTAALAQPIESVQPPEPLPQPERINLQKELGEWVHAIQHRQRDLQVKTGPVVPPYDGPAQLTGERIPRPHPGLTKHVHDIAMMLEDVVELFKLMVPAKTNITASLRDLRADGGYYTFARAGKYEPARATTLRPLFKDRSTILKRQREAYEKRSCVVITGSNKGPDWWEKQANDSLGNDLSVMMGIVMARSWDGSNSFIQNRHAWTLCVSADSEEIFNDQHVPLMKACTDSFSAVVNAIVREQARTLEVQDAQDAA